MQIQAPKSGKSSDDGLIPLINIVFLLLIFFMLMGEVGELQLHAIELPESKTAQPERGDGLKIHIDRHGVYFIEGQSTKVDQLATTLESDIYKEITIVADGRLDNRHLNGLLQLLREHDWPAIKLQVTQ